jgi:hypothetical protein
VITVKPTNRTADWAIAQDVDSSIAGFVSSKKQIASARVPETTNTISSAQAGFGLGVFVAPHFRNATALLSHLLQSFGAVAVRSRNVPAMLY